LHWLEMFMLILIPLMVHIFSLNVKYILLFLQYHVTVYRVQHKNLRKQFYKKLKFIGKDKTYFAVVFIS